MRSVAEAERLFSKAKRILTDIRKYTSPVIVQIMFCLTPIEITGMAKRSKLRWHEPGLSECRERSKLRWNS